MRLVGQAVRTNWPIVLLLRFGGRPINGRRKQVLQGDLADEMAALMNLWIEVEGKSL